MPRTADNHTITTTAIKRLREILDTEISIDEVPSIRRRHHGDTVLRVGKGRDARELSAVVKPHLSRAQIALVLQKAGDEREKVLLISRYVNPVLADELKKAGIQFADCAGNACIRGRGVFVFVKGNRLEEQTPEKPLSRAFRVTGLKVIFTLLCNPGLERKSYREIAVGAAVALGTVGWVLNDLKGMGYLHAGRKGRRELVNRRELFERWVPAYAEQLRPRVLLQRYRSRDKGWWGEADLAGGLWGGEVAAALKTGALRPEMVTIYADKLPPRLVVEQRIDRDPRGNIELMTPFWGFGYDDPDGPLVHPVLVYGDLVAEADARRRAVAQHIRERYLGRYIGED